MNGFFDIVGCAFFPINPLPKISDSMELGKIAVKIQNLNLWLSGKSK